MMIEKKHIVEMINIGDELLLGIRINSHLSNIGKQLSFIGLNINHCQIVLDDIDAISRAIKTSHDRSNIIIITGGLGPTKDDLTLEGFSKALNLSLVYHQEIFDKIEERFSKLGRPISAIHKKQCFQIEGSYLINNERGTAPASIVKTDKALFILLPGPAHELNPILNGKVIPYLVNHCNLSKEDPYIQLRVCGIGESVVEQKVNKILEAHPLINVAFCVHMGIVDVRLSDKNGDSIKEDLKLVAGKCRDSLGEDFIGYGNVSLAEVIYNKLRKNNQTLAVSESCTGGLMGNAFTDISGVSKVFLGGVICYSNEVKILQLGVPEEIIEQHGAVSGECAIAMATGAAENLSSDYGLSVTGFAGPEGGNKENPVGTIHIGLHSPFGIWAKRVRYLGGRLDVKARAVNAALDWLRRLLIQN